jgi:anion-transporting  ArsA/GET3 family ATPase
VCTIDPARRLASSLGVELGDAPTPVPTEAFEATGLVPCPTLHAMMLDPTTALDRLLLSAGRDPALTEQLRSHPLYRTMARELPGMNEYAAVSRLYELYATDEWDLVVLDTPPTTHALDFLDAPGRMLRALQSPAVKWLVKPYLRAGRLSLKLLGGAKAYVLRRLARIVGTGSLRIDAVSGLLAGPAVRYAVVTSPTPASVAEAVALGRQLERRRLRVDALVMNRMHGRAPFHQVEPEEIAADLAQCPQVDRLPAAEQLRFLEWLSATHRRFQLLARADQRQLEWLRRRFAEPPVTATVPLLGEDVHDLGGLHRVAAYL